MKSRYFILAALLTLLFAYDAAATSFTQVVVLGDSLSDNGNFYAATGQPGAPYVGGRRSNGPVAVEYLAARAGAPLVDFAWIGATTGVGNYVDGGTPDSLGTSSLPGMKTVFDAALAANLFPIDPNALYVVWGGANDMFELTDPADAPLFVSRAATNVLTFVGTLQFLGAQHILVPNMPDLGLTPEGRADPSLSFFLTSVSSNFNTALRDNLPPGALYFDTFGLMHSIIADPGAYGLINVTDPCLNGVTVCGAPDEYLFFDGVHPTTAGHAILGNGMADAVPEPSSVVLLLTGLGVLAAAGIRRRA